MLKLLCKFQVPIVSCEGLYFISARSQKFNLHWTVKSCLFILNWAGPCPDRQKSRFTGNNSKKNVSSILIA